MYADGTSRLDELHHRIEWIRVGGQHDLLRVVCSQVVHGPEDDGQHERIKAGIGWAQGVINCFLVVYFLFYNTCMRSMYL